MECFQIQTTSNNFISRSHIPSHVPVRRGRPQIMDIFRPGAAGTGAVATTVGAPLKGQGRVLVNQRSTHFFLRPPCFPRTHTHTPWRPGAGSDLRSRPVVDRADRIVDLELRKPWTHSSKNGVNSLPSLKRIISGS